MQNQKIASQKRIVSLDALRGIAGIIIVIFHVLGIWKLDITDNFIFVKKFGLGVTLFFILSAFSIFLNYRDKIIDNNSLKDFYINRLARIYPLFIFMMIFWIIIRRWEWGTPTTIHELIINIFYIFNLFPGLHEGIVWASWALGVLFLFYSIAPIFMIFVRNVKGAIILTFLLLLLSKSSQATFSDFSHFPKSYAHMSFIYLLPVFGFGILFFFLYKSRKNMNNLFTRAISIIGLASIFITYFMYINIHTIQGYFIIDFIKSIEFYAWALTLSFLVYSQCDYCIPLLNNPVSRFYGKISYSLYLIHPLVIYKLKNVYSLIYSINSYRDVAFIICCLITIIIVTPLAFIANKLIENPGSMLVKNIYTK